MPNPTSTPLQHQEWFASQLLAWYPTHKREMPWRNTTNAYHIWLSEIILQQTRVQQGTPYFEAFVNNFPTIDALANAPQDQVLRLWQGLGYYSRARNLHTTAQYISQELKGVFPDSFKDLLKLKGVGNYTAAAIASFAYNENVAVLDGNVFRVLARFFGIAEDIASPKGIKIFQQYAQEILPKTDANSYNQAIMEFGALQCTPQKPNCMYCPLQQNCKAFLENLQSKLPLKTNKIKVKDRYLNYIFLEFEGKIIMRKRTQGEIWEGLYEPYLEETNSSITLENFKIFAQLQEFNCIFALQNEAKLQKHQLTHQRIWAKFWHIKLNNISEKLNLEAQNYVWIGIDKLKDLPKPILIARALSLVNQQ